MLKKQNGITLIALIITIIVMLILVGVTINVALNGGLFEKAETATRETEEKAILEEMLAMMEITDDGKINAQSIIDKMKEKYKVEGTIPNITITGKLGIYNYIVSENNIKIGKEEAEDLGKYYLKYIQGVFEYVELTDEEIEKYEEEISDLIEQKLVYTFGVENESDCAAYCSINGYSYKIQLIEEDEMYPSLIERNSDEYNKVSSLIQASKSVEAELNEILIGTGYTYTRDDVDFNDSRIPATEEYVANRLSETRSVISTWSGGSIYLKISSNVEDYILHYYLEPEDYSSTLLTPKSIENLNIGLN